MPAALKIIRPLPRALQALREQVIARPARRPHLEETSRRCLVAEIDTVAAEIGRCYRDLPPHAQAAALQLGHSLGTLRRALLT